MAAASVSPELALVDPEARHEAVAQLPRLEAFDFLRFGGAPRRHPDLERFAFLAEFDRAETARLKSRDLIARALLVAALVSAFVTIFATIQAVG